MEFTTFTLCALFIVLCSYVVRKTIYERYRKLSRLSKLKNGFMSKFTPFYNLKIEIIFWRHINKIKLDVSDRIATIDDMYNLINMFTTLKLINNAIENSKANLYVSKIL